MSLTSTTPIPESAKLHSLATWITSLFGCISKMNHQLSFARSIACLWVALVLSIPFAMAQADNQQIDPNELRAKALTALQTGDNDSAIEAADQMIKQAPNDSRTVRLAGDIYLRTGKTKLATKLFNQFVKQEPDALPFLWQRGISLYFTEDYTEGVKQFEVHRKVNPNDVENAAWHFLCVAKAESFEKASKVVLPAPNDVRVPMDEVLAMLSNGNTQAVIDRMEAVPEGTDARASADFYGDFYLGLYADAKGDLDTALRYLTKSAEDAPHNYMGDVARVYRDYLTKQVQKKKP